MVLTLLLVSSSMASVNYDTTLGALEIAIIGCAFLFGIVTVQVYIYHRAYPDDSRFVKSLVAAVWVLELGHMIATSHAVYMEIIKKFGDPVVLVKMPISLTIGILLEGLVTFIVEGFFTYRIYVMYQTHYFAFVCWFLASVRLMASTAYFIVSLAPPTNTEIFTTFADKWSWLIETLQIIGAVTDVLIAIALCVYYLRNNDTTFSSTKILIDKLLMWAISTGLITSLDSVLSLIFFLTMRSNMVWIIMYIWLPKLYSNSFMATLNARNGLREAGKHGVFISTLDLSFLKQITEDSVSTARFPTRVNIDTEAFVLDDHGKDKALLTASGSTHV
ncbi:hypothetical protein K438DRAFT_1802842 [Mycena galopus ATCC 62051]|nr:hypothetical protein K438DRAFT_1802842 [Mycena galopus ATCC 62051]